MRTPVLCMFAACAVACGSGGPTDSANPGAPASVTIAAGDGQIAVSWANPARGQRIAAISAAISSRFKKSICRRANLLLGIASTRWIRPSCTGSRSAAKRKNCPFHP